MVAYGIASVYTPERHREKGYAKHLMRLLHFVLGNPSLLPPFPSEIWGPPPIIPSNRKDKYGQGVASGLYSDVGSKFYGLCGPGIDKAANEKAWIEHDPIGTIWPADANDVTADDIEWIPSGSLEKMWDSDVETMKEEIHSSPDNSKTTFTFLPNHGVAQFLFHRNKSAIPNHIDPEKLWWGAKLTADADGKGPYFATWSLDPDRNGPTTLILTRLRATPSNFGKLLASAQMAARVLALDQVEAWNLEPGLRAVAEELGGTMRRRSDHLPSLAWYGSGTVEWEFNEKFCWC